MIVISPSESVATIASTLNAIGTQQNPNQFGTQRYEILFQPGTYGSAADPLDFQVGYYESVEGLGQNPSQVVINGTIDPGTSAPTASRRSATPPTTSGARSPTSRSTSPA